MPLLAERCRDHHAAGTDRCWPLTIATALVAHLLGMRTQQTALSGLDPLLSVGELAEYLGVPVRTIYDWRQTGHGPRGIRIGRHLKFAVSDVMTWIDSQRDATPGPEPQTG